MLDTTERRAFEEKLLAEVADAVSLPVKNVCIEEVNPSCAHAISSVNTPVHSRLTL